MNRATGIGSMPGEDFTEATRIVLGELTDFPHLPELPLRGPHAGMIGRTLGLIDDLGFDLQPAGWRLTDAPGIDHRRAISLLAQDLDVVEELSQGYVGSFKVQVTGPWTLAANVERPRGDRVLADIGARREICDALAVGIAEHLVDLRRRVPGAQLQVQVDEPALPAVLEGAIPTASGFHRHRSVDRSLASAALEKVFAAIAASDARCLAHCCAKDPPISLLQHAGAEGLSLDVRRLSATAFEELGEALTAGNTVLLGVTDPLSAPEEPRTLRQRAERLAGMLGFDLSDITDQIVLTPTCGLAGMSPAAARGMLTTLAAAAHSSL